MRAEATAGLASRRAWQQTMAIVDPDLRATALAAWFSPATSPDGRRFAKRRRDLFAASEALGAAMVTPLARIVQSDASPDAVGLAADMLRHLGKPALAAGTSLIARLRELRGADPRRLLSTLRTLPSMRSATNSSLFLDAAGAKPSSARLGSLAMLPRSQVAGAFH